MIAMRPIHRGDSPRAIDYEDYRDAFPDLIAKIGSFCSYCERRIPANLAVEHIQPKSLPVYQNLTGRWDNFLLGCVNCNSTKGIQDVALSLVLLPDRDNTSAAFDYLQDGRISIRTDLTVAQTQQAARTLALTGLDRPPGSIRDLNGKLVAIDRVGQRMEVWSIASSSRDDWQARPIDQVLNLVVRTAVATGFFSIWMAVFDNDPVVRSRLIAAFPETATDCFDLVTTVTISPRPANGLTHGGKI